MFLLTQWLSTWIMGLVVNGVPGEEEAGERKGLDEGCAETTALRSCHRAVMVEETIDLFRQTPGRVVCDLCAGLGGHLLRLAEFLAPDGTIVAVDRDPKAIEILKTVTHGLAGVRVVRGLYQELPRILSELSIPEVDFAFLDLGLSTLQLQDEERGFSFSSKGPCDLRMSPECPETGADLLNRLGEEELADLFWSLGGERKARRIAREIVRERRAAPIRTTDQLVRAVLRAVRGRSGRIHPATRCLQSLRVRVNRELEGLEEALEAIPPLLSEGGMLVGLSYHSLEDKLLKSRFREWESKGFEIVFKRPLRPSEQEIRRNRRSRSAKMRALRRPRRPSHREREEP